MHRNFTYSLLGIETGWPIPDVPIHNCNFTYSLLGIETTSLIYRKISTSSKLQFHLLPTRDWNKILTVLSLNLIVVHCNFTYSLLGIETWVRVFWKLDSAILQFHLLPTRDWNLDICAGIHKLVWNCNFTYSLLGIETLLTEAVRLLLLTLQFHLLPTRDWNFIWLRLFLVSLSQIAISLTPY